MKSVVVLLILAASGLYAQSVNSPCPTGYTCTPNIVTESPLIRPDSCPQFYNCTPNTPQDTVASVAKVVTSTSSITYLPKWYGSAGGGTIVPGSGKFVYESISGYLGQETYATTVNEFTLTNSKVTNCTLAGVSKLLYSLGSLTIGTTGLGGGCSSTAGTSGGAASVQGFLNWHIGKSAYSIIVTGDKTFSATGNQAVKITLGVAYGK